MTTSTLLTFRTTFTATAVRENEELLQLLLLLLRYAAI